MSQKVRITAVGFGVSFIELSDEELANFLNEVEEVDEISDIELVSDLVGDSYYEYGFLLGEADINLEVDDENKNELLEDLLEKVKPNEINLSDSSDSHWLVYEAEEDVDITFGIDKFDPKKIELRKTNLSLPNRDVKSIANLYYEDEDLENSNATSSGQIYIVKNDGEIITF